MASNQTQHLKLCQWEADDEVLRADFNADNAKIDEVVSAVKAAEAADIQSVRSAVASCYSPQKKPYAVGTYKGDGTSGRVISVGFTPSAVLVTTINGDVHQWGSGYNEFYGGLTVRGADMGMNELRIVTGGFQVASGDTASNSTGLNFNYIAFR